MGNRFTILDGGMGTMLQRYGFGNGEIPEVLNITEPEVIRNIHGEYIRAGSDVIYTNTFGCNRFKIRDSGYSIAELVDAAVKNAKEACSAAYTGGEAAETGSDGHREVRVAVSIGPLGQMLEPAGTVTFEEAYEAFSEVAAQAQKSGADLIVIETMTDLYEMKAAVLAAKENTELPVMASMSFEKSGRTFTGCSIEAMAATLEGLGVSSVGINCSLGPAEIYPLAERLCKATDIPVFVKPNAGLPNPEDGSYDLTAGDFSQLMKEYAGLGIRTMGGCCGTDPGFISSLKDVLDECSCHDAGNVSDDLNENSDTYKRKTRVCTPTRVVDIDHVTVCGERLNPTGKKRLRQALLDGDMNYVLKQAVLQEEQGAEVLDVNVGVPGIDEAKILPLLVKKLQSVTDLPLQIDSSDPAAIEAALRVYNGKAIVNSVNGEEKSIENILPIVKKYGACVIALTLDEDGIPETAEKRFEIAEKIVREAEKAGIPRENIIADCLTLTASAQQEGVRMTLNAIRRVKEELGLKTALGVSNISFGLPNRPLVNRTFLTLAIECGLDLPIIDPGDDDMMAQVAACEMLNNRDRNAVRYIEKYANYAADRKDVEKPKEEMSIYYALEKGLEEDTAEIVRKMLTCEDEPLDELTIVSDHLIPALDMIGKAFEKGDIYLPQMIQAAAAAQAGFEEIKNSLASKGEKNISLGKVIMATVKGDVHDIGKNIVKVIMENYGFEVIDLGKDVPAEDVLAAVVENDARMVGLSALMTTTLKSMEETIGLIKSSRPECSIMVGGAVLTEEYARKIGADYYCRDAMKSVEAAREVLCS